MVPTSDCQMVRALQDAASNGMNFPLRMPSCINNNIPDNFHIPFELTKVPAVSNFIGRTADIDRLWKFLQPNASNLRKVVVLHGMEGLGKTHLAIHFARLHKTAFTAIFWVNGQDENVLIRSLADIAARLRDMSIQRIVIRNTETEDPKQDTQHVLEWLSQEFIIMTREA